MATTVKRDEAEGGATRSLERGPPALSPPPPPPLLVPSAPGSPRMPWSPGPSVVSTLSLRAGTAAVELALVVYHSHDPFSGASLSAMQNAGSHSQLRPSQLRPSQLRPSQLRPSQLRPSQLRPSQLRPSQLRHIAPAVCCIPTPFPLPLFPMQPLCSSTLSSLLQQSPFTTSPAVFLSWLDALSFSGGGAANAAVAEGLSEALLVCS
ncbi:unnamed protein product [Closterium sp. Naga37s-1]|nr:unnamed protein product [Closterium sp. Naga37s-1]